MSCHACTASGNVNYWCVNCCVRFLLTLPYKEQRVAHLDSIERLCGYEHAEQVRAALLKAWEERKQ